MSINIKVNKYIVIYSSSTFYTEKKNWKYFANQVNKNVSQFTAQKIVYSILLFIWSLKSNSLRW